MLHVEYGVHIDTRCHLTATTNFKYKCHTIIDKMQCRCWRVAVVGIAGADWVVHTNNKVIRVCISPCLSFRCQLFYDKET